MRNHRRDIGFKIIVMIITATLVFLVVSIVLNYFCLFDSSRNDTMSSRKNMAGIIAGSIAGTIDNQADLVKINASSDILKEAVEASNLKYSGMDAEAIKRHIMDIDSEWLKSAGDDLFAQGYLGNKASSFLKSNTKQKAGFFNMLVVDKYGALVGASYKGRNFYYGYENWFREIISQSGSVVFYAEAMLDEPSGRWAFPIVSAIVNDGGEVIGAYKALVDISVLTKPIEDFVVGKGGKAALVDGRGYLIFYPGVKPFSNKLCEYNELKKLLSDNKGYSVIDTAYMGRGKTAVAFAPVIGPALSGKDAKLYIVVLESSGELFSPLNKLAIKMVISSLILVFLVLLLADRAFKDIFVGPMRKLLDGIKSFGEGKLDYRVDITTGDEIEDLGVALNNAAESLSHITTSIKMLDKEKSECKITQQKFEKENIGFLSIMSQIYGSISDINKDLETTKQGGLLQARAAELKKKLEQEIYASKLEAGSLEFKMEPKDLRDIIKESVFAFEPKIRDKGLDLRLEIPKTALLMRADKDKVRQVINMLMENSLMATEKGYIAISVIQTKDGVECSISDTGIAIPKELINEVFDRFASFSRIPPKEGAWISPDFYILKEVVEKHGGSVDVESKPDKITKFTLKLPKAATS